MGNPTVFWRSDDLSLGSGLRQVNNGTIFAGQGQEKGGQKDHADLHGVRIRGRMVREGRGNGNFLSTLWEEAFNLDLLPLFLVNLLLASPASALDQTTGGAFLCHKTRTQGPAPYKPVAVEGVRSSW